MSKIIHCYVQMFSRTVTMVVEDNGVGIMLRQLGYNGYEEQLLSYAKELDIPHIHLIGNKLFLQKTVNKIKTNTKYNCNVEVTVN